MPWGIRNWGSVAPLLQEHIVLALIPTVVGLVVAVPLGLLAYRNRQVRTVVTVLSSVVFTIPSLALFVTIPAIAGTAILDPINVVAALTLYSVSLQVRAVFEALDSVSGNVQEAATAVGFSPARRTWQVDLPLMIPVLTAGTRVVTVTNISLVSVGAVIGVGGLGELFTAGYQRSFPEQIITGIVLILLLAVVADRLIATAGYLLTPWTRAGKPSKAKQAQAAAEDQDPEVTLIADSPAPEATNVR